MLWSIWTALILIAEASFYMGLLIKCWGDWGNRRLKYTETGHLSDSEEPFVQWMSSGEDICVAWVSSHVPWTHSEWPFRSLSFVTKVLIFLGTDYTSVYMYQDLSPFMWYGELHRFPAFLPTRRRISPQHCLSGSPLSGIAIYYPVTSDLFHHTVQAIRGAGRVSPSLFFGSGDSLWSTVVGHGDMVK